MTDPTTPNPDQPVEGTRDAAGKASDVLESIKDVVGDLAEKAAPVVREISAKAADVLASAADKAAPLAQKAGEVTADASGKLAEKSRAWASDVREALTGNDGTPATPATSADATASGEDDATPGPTA